MNTLTTAFESKSGDEAFAFLSGDQASEGMKFRT